MTGNWSGDGRSLIIGHVIAFVADQRTFHEVNPAIMIMSLDITLNDVSVE